MDHDLEIPIDIHPNDFIFAFIRDDPTLADKDRAPQIYLDSGATTANVLRDVLNQHRPSRQHLFTMLEFASGYGRISRHFRKVIPEADVTACDIHPEAIGFLREMGIKAELSAGIPEEFNLSRKFDVIFALSFFTHMPRRTWGRWLYALADHLEPQGLLIFTTHGQTSRSVMGNPDLDADGFWFTPSSEQADLSTAEYGNTITSFDYVYRHVTATALALERFQTAGWGHQDLYVLRHAPAPTAIPVKEREDG